MTSNIRTFDDPTQQTAIQHFASRLQAARREAGDPSYRTIARRSGGEIAPSSISRVLTGSVPPSWAFTRAFLRGCEVDEHMINETWRQLWKRLTNVLRPLDEHTPPLGLLAGLGTPAGNECGHCGAWVANAERHHAWHDMVGVTVPGNGTLGPAHAEPPTMDVLASGPRSGLIRRWGY